MQQEQENVRRRRQPEVEQNVAGALNGFQIYNGNGPIILPPSPEVDLARAVVKKKSLQTVISVNQNHDGGSGIKLQNFNALKSDSASNNAEKSSIPLRIKYTGLSESSLSICIQTLFPFLMAGLGMVAAGVLLDKVQHWKVFQSVSEIFILVPALLGLKGNLEMTLASRLSTYANQGYLDDKNKCWTIVWGNVVTVEAQAMVVALIASLLAQTLGWISNGKWELGHAIILCAGSFLTGAIASGLLGLVMILVVLLSRKFGVNPDNVATPIAASLGDLITLSLLANFTQWLFSITYDSNWFWIGPSIIVLSLALTPCFVWLSYCNSYTKDVIQHGWTPVLSAMAISSSGGLVLNSAVSKFPGIAVYSPVMNGIGGNLVAIQASRISTSLHQSGCPVGSTLGDLATSLPSSNAFSSSNPHSVGAKVMLFMVIPGHIVFLFVITMLKGGHTVLTPSFVSIYLLASFVQVWFLLQVCNWLVFYLWRIGKDPDNASIPYLTGLGDFLGTGLLACAFTLLSWIGDRSVVGSH